jgi:HAD superfamily hydrolase (TIGR01509 family)
MAKEGVAEPVQPTRSAPLDTLLLDAGGVLVFPSWERVSRVMAVHGVAVGDDVLARAGARAMLELDRPVGETTDASRAEDLFLQVLSHAGVERSEACEAGLAELRDYHARHNLWERVPGDVEPFLARLKDAGIRLVLVSNANGTVRRHFERLGLARYFHTLIDSHEEGVEKPDPRLFEIALERSGAAAGRAVHVGDLYHVDVLGARRAGIDAWLYDPAGSHPDKECRRFGDLAGVGDAVLAARG